MKPAQTNPNEAGTYMVDANGVRTLVAPVTVDHPDGNCARPAEDAAAPAEDGAGKSVLAKRLEAKLKGGDQ